MGLFDFFKKQFIDVIEWTESGSGVLSCRYPMTDNEIQNGAQLTVRETQMALFVNEGKIADLFSPGLYTLTTQTLPILTSINNWDKAFASPFKSDVYFFSTREQIDQRWGTPNAITIPDSKLGPIRIRAHGSYSYAIHDPKVFFTKISGSTEIYTADELSGQLRSIILSTIASFLGNAQTNFIDMAANQMKFSETLKEALSASFESYGLTLKTFFVQSLSLPENLQAHLDKVASITMLGDLNRYAQFQSAESITMAAQNPSGAAGLSAGLAAGSVIADTLKASMTKTNPGENPMDTIQKLHDLKQKGIISEADFETKKAELLKKI